MCLDDTGKMRPVRYVCVRFPGKCLYLSGLIPEPMNASDDYRLKEIGIGFTNFVSRCSKGSVELTRFFRFVFIGHFSISVSIYSAHAYSSSDVRRED